MTDEQPTPEEFLAWFSTDDARERMQPLLGLLSSFSLSEGGTEVSHESALSELGFERGMAFLTDMLPAFAASVIPSQKVHEDAPRLPADLSDAELRRAAFEVVSHATQNVGQRRIQAAFQAGVKGDPDFPHPIPTLPEHQVLTLLTNGAESAAAANALLDAWASTTALSQLRHLHETQALAAWLINGTEGSMEARAFALTMDTIDIFGRGEDHWYQAAKTSGDPQLRKNAVRWRKIKATLQGALDALWTQRGYPRVAKPNRQRLFDTHFTEVGGYPAFAMLSNAGGHPSLMQSMLLYGDLKSGKFGYDFDGLHVQRAYWITQVGAVFLGLLDLAAPVLGWNDWDEEASALCARFEPVAEEAVRRYNALIDEALSKRSSWA